MAFGIRKLAAFGSSRRSISSLIANSKSNLFTVKPKNPISIICSFRHFSTDHTVLKPHADTFRLEHDARTDQEFGKWWNGGGTFHKSASIHPTVFIEIGAIVHSQSLVGANVHIGSGAIVGPAVTIGESTKLGYNVSLANCDIGDSCVIHNGVCIGQDGFGFLVDEQGNVVKKPQNLKAKIGNHVEIGANTCIDRGSWRDTIVGDHSKIDNLVQIGHNVTIGKSCIICGLVGIAGSATLGDFVTLGGRVGIRDHVFIASKDLSSGKMIGSAKEVEGLYYFDGANVRLAANSCATKDINEPGDYGGFPAMPIGKWRKQVAIQRQALK